MFDGVHFTGTIDLGALSAALLVLLGLFASYLKSKIDADNRHSDTVASVERQGQQTRDCIHALPGHPENPSQQVQENFDKPA